MSFPSNRIEFQDRFPDEESCWRYLREVRWPEGFECPDAAFPCDDGVDNDEGR